VENVCRRMMRRLKAVENPGFSIGVEVEESHGGLFSTDGLGNAAGVTRTAVFWSEYECLVSQLHHGANQWRLFRTILRPVYLGSSTTSLAARGLPLGCPPNVSSWPSPRR
jgi:hypothetical protein